MKRLVSLRLAFVLSFVGGALILLGGLMIVLIGSYAGSYGFGGLSQQGSPLTIGLRMLEFGFGIMGLLGMFCGGVVMLSAVMLRRNPRRHTTSGSLISLFSLFSVFGGAMGFGVGLILSLLGGGLALSWTHPEP